MPQRVYATLADFDSFTDTELTDAEITKLLRRASLVIDGLTRLARYDVDVDGNPTDADVMQAFTDATCAQLAWWDDTDDVTGAESTAGAIKIGSVSLGTTSSGGSGVSAADSRVAPEAAAILAAAGLLSSLVSY